MEVEQRASWLRDWCSDLAEFPIDAVRAACRKWRQSGSTKFPTPGLLLPLVRSSLPVEKAEIVRPWRQATEDEYRAMTVREKIREHTIMAHEAFGEAGPMFRNESSGDMAKARGAHLKPDEMPDAHRRWTEIGRNHMAEVKRLREIINQPHRVAAE
jgi:hypothetical protein